MIKNNEDLRNIAIIAHVDHGKTTLVNSLFRQSGVFRDNQEIGDRLMDSMELEQERGITIAAKNCAISWKGVKINIIDTPGHADFGGEVERGLSMADGVILLVDAAEGPLPQTRFVLQKALSLGLKVIIVINKIDRQDSRAEEVLNEVYDLLIDLDADENLLDAPVLFADGRSGVAGKSLDSIEDNLHSLLDIIIKEVPGPEFDDEEPFQMLVSDLSYSDFLGRLAVGKVINGSAKSNDVLVRIKEHNEKKQLRVSKIQIYEGMGLKDCEEINAGDIVVLAGIDDVSIGDTICNKDNPKALPRIKIDEPTVSMTFYKNSSPLAGKEGKFVQSTKIGERLEKEALLNVSIKVERSTTDESFIVKGRGEFQMAIIVETMRREGFELCVGRPHIIFKKDEKGKVLEPIERLYIDVEDGFSGVVTEKLSKRKGLMQTMDYTFDGRVKMQFEIPSRGLIGYRDEFLTDTKGTGIMSSFIKGYEEYKGDFPDRHTGSLVGDRSGVAVPYALNNLEARGRLFVTPGDPIYEGMIVGEHNRDNDLNVNACKTKNLTNVRAAGKDDAVTLTPVVPMSLEQAIQFIREDELVEVTPSSIRLRKRILSAAERKVADKYK